MQFARHLHNFEPSYIRTILQAATAPGMISLAGGLPAQQHFPSELLKLAAEQVLSDSSALQYSRTQGEPDLCRWVAETMAVESNQVLICNGAQQAMDLVVRSLLNADDTVIIEVPGYLGALQVFHLANTRVVSVEQTAAGPDLKQLETAFRRHRPRLFYAVPDFHNPTGCCWSLKTRYEVLRLAEYYGVIIVEDAPYRDIRFEGDELPCLFELAPERVCYLGSFSKVVSPGLRLGYLCGPANLVDMALRVKQATDLHSSTLCQRLIVSVLNHGDFKQLHLNELKRSYRQRRDVLAAALQRYLNEDVNFLLPEGGMFIWVKLNNVDTAVLAQKALTRHVAVVPGSVFYIDDAGKGNNYLRLNFSHATPFMLEQAVERLSTVIDS